MSVILPKDVKIVGISGKARSGKDQFCKFLRDELRDRGHVVDHDAFANDLKVYIGNIFRFNSEQLWGTLKEVPDSRTDLVPRYVLQEAGVLLRQIYKDVWVDSVLLKHFRYPKFLLISDVRFENECAIIQANGGYLVRVVRNETIDSGADHESETALDHLPRTYWNRIIENNNSLDELRQVAMFIAAELEDHFDGSRKGEGIRNFQGRDVKACACCSEQAIR